MGTPPLLVGGALIAATGLALTAAAESLVAVIGLRLLLGVAEAVFFVASFAALADLAPPARPGEALSYNSLGLYLGLAFGPPLGEVLVETRASRPPGSEPRGWHRSPRSSCWGWARRGRVVETRTEGKLIHRGAIPASLGFFASLLAIGGFLSLASLHAQEIGLGNASVPLFVYGAVVVTCRIAFARVPDRIPSLALGAAALSGHRGRDAGHRGLDDPDRDGGRHGLDRGRRRFSTPAFFSAIFATAKPSERGAAAGTASLFIDLGLGFGPIALGFVAQGAGIPFALAAGAGFAVLGAFWSWHLHRSVPATPAIS